MTPRHLWQYRLLISCDTLTKEQLNDVTTWCFIGVMGLTLIHNNFMKKQGVYHIVLEKNIYVHKCQNREEG